MTESNLLDSAPDGALWEWETATDAVRFSAPVRALMRVAAGPLGTTRHWWTSRIDSAHRDRVMQQVERAVASGDTRYEVAYSFRGDDGTLHDVVERGFVVRSQGAPARVLGDLRARGAAPDERTLEERVAENELQFRTFVESIPQLAWTADANGWIDFYNRRWYDYTGSTFEQMEGWGWVSVHDPDLLPRMLRIWRHSFSTGQPWEDEFLLRRGSDGMFRWHLSRAMPMKDKNGKVVRWFGTNTDIHDQKMAMEEYARLLDREQRARSEAERVNRAKDEFLAVLSHELRTPLTAVVGWAHLLAAQPDMSAERRKDAIGRIVRNAEAQAKLVADLLDVSRIIAGKLQVSRDRVSLSSEVGVVVEESRDAATVKGIALTFTDAAHDAVVAGDATRLRQIAANLVHNAIKFSSGGVIEVRLVRAGDGVELSVRDEGIGFAAELAPQLFRRFQQADGSSTRAHGGLGLGLAIVAELAALHGGRVAATSPGPQRGAVFTVWLPIATADVNAAALATAAETTADARAPVSLSGIKILAVDDQPSAREVIAAMLLSCGATVTVAGSVHEAMRALRAETPDVIVSDIGMPEEDGYGLVARVRALADVQQARIPIVALTAFASAEDRARALQSGFDDFIAKPVDVTTLSHALIAAARTRVQRPG